MANLSSAIIEARKRHEAEIAERLKRRQARQRAEIERLNSARAAAEAEAAAAERSASEAAPDPQERIESAVAGSAAGVVIASPPADTAPAAAETAPIVAAPEPATPIPVEPVAAHEATREPALPGFEPEAPPPADLVLAPLTPEPAVPAPALHAVPAPQPIAPARPAPVERLLPEEAFDAPAPRDELERPPDGRYLKLRNDIIDRVKPYLTGNQFAVYLEIYRQTIGRGRTAAWFRTRDIQTACNLGSDNTVRDAYPVLEQKRLIKLDPNRRTGSPKGLFITVLSVERALERLERQSGAQQQPAAAQPAALRGTVDRVAATPAAAPSLVERLTRDYGVSPSVAPQLLERLGEEDWELLPYLFERLDRVVASGKVHNPGGLLRVWIESFDAWRPELVAEKRRAEELERAAREALSRDELMLEWFRETEAEAARRYAALPSEARDALEARGREELLAKSPFVRTWSEEQWANQLEVFAKAELRRELGSFDEWLAARRER